MCNPLYAQVLPASEHSVRKEPKKEEALQPDKLKRSSGTQQEGDICQIQRLAVFRDYSTGIYYPDWYGTSDFYSRLAGGSCFAQLVDEEADGRRLGPCTLCSADNKWR